MKRFFFLLFISGCSTGFAQGIKDIENNTYDTVRIGRQIWFSKNLAVTRLNDGTPISNVIDQSAWAAAKNPAYCWYNNNQANGALYGALYNGYVVKTGKLCPAGWRVPSDAEWSELVSAMGGPFVAAGKLKATGTANWQSPNVGATNEVGFSALPGGYRPSDNFYAIGVFGFWWSSTEYEPDYAWTQSMKHDEPGMNAPPGVSFGLGLSVRCMKEVTAPCRAADRVQTVRSCVPYTWIDGITYNLSTNAPTLRLTSKSGCDSLVRLHLTMLVSTSSTQSVTACDSYTWIDGKTYTASTDASLLKLINKAGCDSLVRLNLTIRKSTTSTQVISACDSYKWIDGNTYTSSTNAPKIKLVNRAGCDSLVSLNLTIKKAEATLSQQAMTISSDLTGESYAWFNCSTNEYVENANQRNFEPRTSGSYRVEVIRDGCKRTSPCLVMVVTGTGEIEKSRVQVYPNPVTDFLYVSSALEPVKSITVYDARGIEVTTIQATRDQLQVDLRKIPAGIYLAEIYYGKETLYYRFIKL